MYDISEFISITEDILNHDHFNKLKNERHHGTSRYNHSLRVALRTYKKLKKKNTNYKELTRISLLHDFYTNEDLNYVNSFKALSYHPEIASKNAVSFFKISNHGKDMIDTHMFPLKFKIPKTIDAIRLSLIDKSVSTYEMLRFKLFKLKDPYNEEDYKYTKLLIEKELK